MGRVIITRHPNGEPQAVAGWDEPLYSYFFQFFDEDGEIIYDVGGNRRGEIMSLPALRIAARQYDGYLPQRVLSRLKWQKALRDAEEVVDLTETSTPPNVA